MTAMAALIIPLGYVPFRDPWAVDGQWLLLLLPLIVGISVVYKTIKLADLHRLPREATVMSLQLVAFMILVAAALWLLTELA